MFKLKSVLLQAAVMDFCLGLAIYLLANRIQYWLHMPISPEQPFLRIAGGFLVFVAYLYYLAYLHHEQHIILVQATLMLRFIFIVVLYAELILLPAPFGRMHVAMLLPALGETYFAAMQIYHLRKLGRPLLPLGG